MSTEKPDLAVVVAELAKSRAYQRGAWVKVIEIGRQYAQVKLHGSYVENGRVITVSHSARSDMVEHFQSNLLHAIEAAFLEDALMGAALADKT